VSTDFWLSFALAIPLAIAANLLTPKLQLWLERRSSDKALKRKGQVLEERKKTAERLRSDFVRVSALHADRAELQLLLTVSVLKASMIGALTAAGAGVMFAYASVPRLLGSRLETLAEITTIGGQLFSLFGSVLVFQICNRAFKDYTRVKEFQQFKEATEQELSSIEQELESNA